MSPFEKALFYWTEVHLFGLELPTLYPAMPYLRLRAEDLLSSSAALQRLTDFLQVPYRKIIYGATRQVVDAYRFKTSIPVRFQEIRKHPRTIRVAKKLGYDIDLEHISTLRERYVHGGAWLRRPLSGIVRRLKSRSAADPGKRIVKIPS